MRIHGQVFQVALASAVAAFVASSASAQNPPVNDATWRGYSVTRTITAAGNTQYRVYANYSASNITYLNAFDFRKVYTNGGGLPTQVGTNLSAYHSGLGESTWIPQGTATASHVNDDSWVTSTGTHVGSQTALDPSFIESDADGNPIPAALATPPSSPAPQAALAVRPTSPCTTSGSVSRGPPDFLSFVVRCDLCGSTHQDLTGNHTRRHR
jgi:hypothetical protein